MHHGVDGGRRPTAERHRPARRISRDAWFLPTALALVALSRLIWIGLSPLQPDEAYYWEWSRHLAAGYFDHPPLIAYVVRLTTAWGGTPEWAVRVGMVALGVGTCALIYNGGTLVGGRRAGACALAIAATSPVFVLPSTFVAPDGPLLFLWAATVVALLQAIRSHGRGWWLAAGLALGLAVLAKYTALLLVPSVALFLLLSRSGWRRPGPYLAAALALCIVAPNLGWELQHGLVGFSFQAAHGACLVGLGHTGILQGAAVYLATQAGLVSPPLALLLGGATAASALWGLRRGEEAHLLLACCTLTIGVAFLVAHGARHWTAPAYISAAVSAGSWLSAMLHRLSTRRALAMGCVAAVFACAALESVVLEGTYVTKALAGGHLVPLVERVMPSLVAPAPDWHAVGRAVAEAQARNAPAGDGLTLWAATYGMAAEVAFYTPRHPRVFSGSNQYALWGLPAAPAHAVLFIGPADGLDQIAPSPGHAATRTTTVVAGVRLTILPGAPEGTARARAQKLRALTAFGYWRAATCLPARRG